MNLAPTPCLFPVQCVRCESFIRQGELSLRLFGLVKGMAHHQCPTLDSASSTSNCTRTVSLPTGVLKVPVGLSYLPYQDEGIRRLMARIGETGKALLADEMGLGKTVQAIGLLNQRDDWNRVLIVCPASLRYNWVAELRRWLTIRCRPALFPEEIDIDDGVLVCSYNQLSKFKSAPLDLLILDEAHATKNSETLRAAQVKRVAKRAKNIVALSGSPFENRTAELWTLLQLLAPEEWDGPGVYKGQPVGMGCGAGEMPYLKRYAGARIVKERVRGVDGAPCFRNRLDVSRSTHVEELGNRLRQSGLMVRRLKRDVLPDLPAKRRELIVLPPPEGGLLAAEHAAFAATGLTYESDVESLTKAPLLFQELAAARKAVALAKVPLIVEHVRRVLGEGVRKVVLFAHHREVIGLLSDAFGLDECVLYYGGVPERERAENVKRFQTDDAVRVFLGGLTAAGVGLTLTASSHVVFGEIDWKDPRQAEDRVHRIGQTAESVLIQTLVFDWSVDANMARAMVAKIALSEKTLDR